MDPTRVAIVSATADVSCRTPDTVSGALGGRYMHGDAYLARLVGGPRYRVVPPPPLPSAPRRYLIRSLGSEGYPELSGWAWGWVGGTRGKVCCFNCVRRVEKLLMFINKWIALSGDRRHYCQPSSGVSHRGSPMFADKKRCR